MAQFVLPSGELTTADGPAAEQLRSQGVHELSAQQAHSNDLHEQYSSWLYAPPAAAAIEALRTTFPGVQAAGLGALEAASPDMAKSAADFIQGTVEAHPSAAKFGMGVGILGSAAATGGLSLVAQGVLGAAYRADDLALQHIQDPEGSEKMFAHYGAGAILDMALGAGFGVAAGKLLGAVGNKLAQGGARKAGEAIEAKGEDMLMSTTLPGKSQPWLGAKGALDDAKAYIVNNDMAGKTPKELKALISERSQVTQSLINETRTTTKGIPLPVNTQLTLAGQLRTALSGTGAEKSIMGLLDPTRKFNVAKLHNMRMRLDKLVNWAEPSSAYSQSVMKGRDLLSQAIDGHLIGLQSNPVMVDQATRWAAANKEFSTLMNLKGALKAAGPASTSVMDTLTSIGSKLGIGGMIAQGVGVGTGGAAGLVLKGVSDVAGALPKTLPATSLVGLGRLLQKFDERVVQGTVNRMGGGVFEAAGQRAGLQTAHFNALSSVLGLFRDQPLSMAPALASHLEKQGVPPQVVDATLVPATRAVQHLAKVLPRSPWTGMTLTPIPWAPTLKDKAQFMERASAALHPLETLHGNPSDVQMATIREVYPALFAKVGDIIQQHASRNPGLPPAGVRWASKVAGLPASPLALPQMRATIVQEDQQAQAQRQLESQKANARRNPSPGRPAGTQDDFTTRLQKLQK